MVKKLILALIALACAFAISSCCDQSYCPGKMRSEDEEKNRSNCCSRQQDEEETSHRGEEKYDKVQQLPGQERQHPRW